MNSRCAHSQQSIQSIDKGLTVLEIIEEARGPITLQEIWRKLRWNKATIHRILYTFQHRGYLKKDPDTKGYTLGIKILALYNAMTRNFNVPQIVRPYLNEIVEKTGETAHIAITLNNMVVFLDRIRSGNIFSANTEIGQRLPMHCTAIGKAYLAFLDEDELDKNITPPLDRFTDRTICNVKDLKAELGRIRAQGFSIDFGEYNPDLRCVAAPILDHQKYPIAMIGISGHRSRLSQTRCNEIGQMIREMARKISTDFGHPVEARDHAGNGKARI